MKFGIDKLSFYTSHYYLDLKSLAAGRNISFTKFYDGLWQRKMAISPPGEDIVTLAANACHKILNDKDKNSIEMLLFATESGIDASKSAGIYVHKLLNLPSRCRILELKQACYSSTAGLHIAMSMLKQNPKMKILLIASDIAKYKMNTPAESSQGVGAVAMLLSANPNSLIIDSQTGFYIKDTVDFWRPNYLDHPCVDGKLSCELYLKVLEETWKQYTNITGKTFSEHGHFCYHVPVPKLVMKAHKYLAKINNVKDISFKNLEHQFMKGLDYSQQIGNCYTASLYLSIISLMDNLKENLSNRYLGLYSYGSGCVGEYFSAKISKNYRDTLYTKYHQDILNNRKELSYKEYEDFYNFTLPQDGRHFVLPNYETGKFRLTAINKHKRIYKQVSK